MVEKYNSIRKNNIKQRAAFDSKNAMYKVYCPIQGYND